MTLVEIARRSIFPGRKEASSEVLAAASRGAPSEVREECGFYGSADDAAAQQEGFNLASFGLVVGNGDAHQTVISKAVSHFDGENLPSWTSGYLRDLLFTVALGGQVELIGLL